MQYILNAQGHKTRTRKATQLATGVYIITIGSWEIIALAQTNTRIMLLSKL